MKNNNKKVLVVAIVLGIILISAIILHIGATTVKGEDIAEFILDHKVESLIVRKYVLNEDGPPTLVEEDCFKLGQKDVGELVRLYEENDFKSKNKLFDSLGTLDDYFVEYVVHCINAEDEQVMHINNTCLEITDKDTNKVTVKNEVVITMYDINANDIIQVHKLTPKGSNWRENLERVLYDK